MDNKHGLPVEKPASIWNKPVIIDGKVLFEALGKAGIVGLTTGRWDDALTAGLDLLGVFKLKGDSPSQLAWRLIHGALLRALNDLVKDSHDWLQVAPKNTQRLDKKVGESLKGAEIYLKSDFFKRPSELDALPKIRLAFAVWLEGYGANEDRAREIANRLNSYFVFALEQEWLENASVYEPIQEALNTPFTKASERARSWLLYRAWLQRQVDEPMFGEVFSLRRVYIPLRAYYERRASNPRRGYSEREMERVVVMLEEELDAWLSRADKDDAVRVISGGPGSGKPLFSRCSWPSTPRETFHCCIFLCIRATLNLNRLIRRIT